jgi:hypothetical protein
MTEIERLNALIADTAEHWMALQFKHPIQWEGAIDSAMAAACAEIEALTAEVERLRERLAALDQQAEALGGCGDANCVIHRPKGQHTNGGCHCCENRTKMRVWTQQVAYFRSKVRAALEKQP